MVHGRLVLDAMGLGRRMEEYSFEIEVSYRKEFTVNAESRQDALMKAHDEMLDCDLNDGADWWFSWAGLYDEQGNLQDEALA